MREKQRSVAWMGGAALSWFCLGQGCVLPEASKTPDAGSRSSDEPAQLMGGKGGRVEEMHATMSEDSSHDAGAREDAVAAQAGSGGRAANSGDEKDASVSAMASAGKGGQRSHAGTSGSAGMAG